MTGIGFIHGINVIFQYNAIHMCKYTGKSDLCVIFYKSFLNLKDKMEKALIFVIADY